ncbi:cell wall metabolism sensor histidine kinase WalK [Vagococcus coleopterorum]|uniref:histidine kinase n=1 Tax=Vagococcus coleopterorum TaxID=2714946 RepID=A0A6G8ANC2_9ENTE|nr:ATP-binding protein [Vagococcus coleopterorum]QIL46470.1 cell wall metabolism sensor histidine kinase WalK [Vagococcus coleopterorum]
MKLNKKMITVIIMAIILVIAGYFFSNRYVTKQLFSQHRKEMIDEANVILYATDITDWSTDISVEQKQLIKEISNQNSQRISVVSPEGTMIFDSESDSEIGNNMSHRPEIKEVLSGDKVGSDIRMSATLKESYYYIAIPVMSDGKLMGILRLSEKASGFVDNINQFKKLIMALLIAFMVIVFLLGWNVNSIQKRRELVLTKALTGIKKGEYTDKYLLTDNGELSQLGLTVRSLADELEKQTQDFNLSEQRFEELLNVLSLGVVVISQDRQIVMANPFASHVLGLEGQDLGKDYHHYLPGVDLYEQVEATFETNQSFSTKKEWQQHWYKIKGNTILNDHQKQVVILFYDVTDEENLLVHQSDFIGNVSHELKTPVTAIKGFSESLLDGAKDQPEVAEDFIQIINQQSIRLENLITDILELSKVSSETGDKLVQPVDLRKTLNDLKQQYELELAKKDLTLEFESVGKGLIFSQEQLVYQVLDNILSNSVKYTDEGGLIKVMINESSDEVGVQISDNGRGIPEADLSRVFERFYRVDKARTSDIKGTGLGLSIVKELVETLQGEIKLTSQENKGTTVTVTLPKGVDQ